MTAQDQAPPKLRRLAFHVWLDPRPDLTPNSPELDDSELEYHHVRIRGGDQLRAELEAKRQNLGSPKDSPMHLTALWLWAALVRMGVYSDKFAAFKLALVNYDPDKPEDDPDDGDDAGDVVVPTEASTS